MNDIRTMVINRRTLIAYCNKNGLALMGMGLNTPKSHFKVIRDGDVIGVISCMPSNNGKYQAYKAGTHTEEYFDSHVACPAFYSFEMALEHITR